MDTVHKTYCSQLAHISYSMPYKIYLSITPYLQLREERYETIKDKFTLASQWTDVVNRLTIEDNAIPVWKYMYYLTTERLSQAMSLLYALQMLPGRQLGYDSRPLEDLITFNVHVVSSSPILDSTSWEIFMHRLPKLVELNVVFVMQGLETNKFHDNIPLKPIT